MVVNLPVYLTSFIGRTKELADIRSLLPKTRLLTLTGPGGSGKTRLAAHLVRDLGHDFSDRAWWVDLAEVNDSRLVTQAVAQSMGLREIPGQPFQTTISRFLGERRTLLILDNCEHLVETCAHLSEALLRTCPALQMITTSREPLGIDAEVAWRVPPLSLPGRDPSPLAEAMAPRGSLQFDAVRLFVERAQTALPSFKLTSQDEAATVHVCRQLDGMPLALELAATWVPLLTVRQIADRLDDRLELPSTGRRTTLPRHQTLRAMIGWSYELLSTPEQHLFRRLAVFANGFNLEAAEQVCADEPPVHGGIRSDQEKVGLKPTQILELLAQLVNKSLIVVDRSKADVARYRLLEMLRQYAFEQLRASGEMDELRTRHQHYYVHLGTGAEPHLGLFLTDRETFNWLQRLEPDYENLGAALAWGVSNQMPRLEASLRLAASLHWYWVVHGFFTEPRRILSELLEKSAMASPETRASALATAGNLACWQGDFESARPTLEEAQLLFQHIEDSRGIAFATHGLGWMALGLGNYAEAEERFQASLDIARDLDDRWLISFAVHFLGIVNAFQGDFGPAREYFEECIALCLELGGATAALAFSHFHLGRMDRFQGNYAGAWDHLQESLRLFQTIGDHRGMTFSLVGFVGLATAQHEARRGARLCGAVANLRETLGTFLEAGLLAEHERDIAVLRAELGDTVFEKTWAQGKAISLDEAIAYALGQADPFDEPPAAQLEPVSAELRLFALGPTRVYRGQTLLQPADWTFAKPKELLYYLLAESAQTKEQIGLAFWPEASPGQLRSRLKSTLYHLRKALGRKEWIVYEAGRYAFNRSLDYWYDVDVFETYLGKARELGASAPDQAIRYFERAIQLYQGDYLEDLAAEQWCQSLRESLRRQHLAALLALGDLLFAESLIQRAAETYHQAIGHDNLLEEAYRGLMRCHSRLGESGLALRQYQALVDLLADELGAEPANETKALHRQLKRGQEI